MSPRRHPADFVLVPGEDSRQDPVRLLVLQAEARPPVDVADEPMVMTFPHLLVRELIALLGISLFLVVISLVFDAPLEELANPQRTPNPAKAPWYFLGLQELLHYYPPVVAGVLMPALVVLGLAIIPYFDINLKRPGLWTGNRRARLRALVLAVAVLSVVLAFTGAHPPWAMLIPLWVVALVMCAPLVAAPGGFVGRYLAPRSLAFWIFSWFLLVAVVLTIAGVFFRGPAWSLTLPWRDGIFY